MSVLNSWEDPSYNALVQQANTGFGGPAIGAVGQTGGSNSLIYAGGATPNYSNGSTSLHISKPIAPPPPAAPNLTPLQNQLKRVNRQDAIKKAMSDYDSLIASTQAQGFQSANNAGATYANRMMQMGVNPIASGVVAAQAKMPVFKQIHEIETNKEQTRLDAQNRADSLASQIATNVAQLQQSYTSMLADYNLKRAGYDLDLSKFNASQSLEAQKLALMAAQSSGSGGGGKAAAGGADQAIFPGYITNSGPVLNAQVGGRTLPGQVIQPSAILSSGRPMSGFQY